MSVARKIARRKGMNSTIEKNITNAELDTHCLIIEPMRPRLRGMGQYQISSKVEATDKYYISSFPANVHEEDLDVLLGVANMMRQRMQRVAKPDEVVDMRRERLDDADGKENGRVV
ncbi:MAG: hypothetical protein LQ337_005759 [Flavoplaca oasis]|nr:MAG: hypothetical protein LQ337_005759 [Flavoplaca oasis]